MKINQLAKTGAFTEMLINVCCPNKWINVWKFKPDTLLLLLFKKQMIVLCWPVAEPSSWTEEKLHQAVIQHCGRPHQGQAWDLPGGTQEQREGAVQWRLHLNVIKVPPVLFNKVYPLISSLTLICCHVCWFPTVPCQEAMWPQQMKTGCWRVFQTSWTT